MGLKNGPIYSDIHFIILEKGGGNVAETCFTLLRQ